MVDRKEIKTWGRLLHILMKSQSFDLISGPEKLSRLATPTMGAWNFQTIRRRALLHWPTSYWWHQVSKEKKEVIKSRIYQEQLCMESTFLCPFKNWGLGQGSGWKRGTDFLIKMDHWNISSCNYFAIIEKLWSRWSSPWTKSSWSNETKAPGIT